MSQDQSKPAPQTRVRQGNGRVAGVSCSLRTKPRRCATIHDHCLTGHEGGLFIIGEEIDGMSDLFRLAHTSVDSFESKVIQPFLHVARADMSTPETSPQHLRIHCTARRS